MGTVVALGLTAAQKTFRKRLLGGSDANTIMSGDRDRILRLWQEKRGEIEPENLDHILPVRMGQYTEPFNRRWFEETTGRLVTNVGDERISLDFPLMGCTLDGVTDDGTCVWEAKHVNAFSKEDEVLARYMPQLTHNMIVTELPRAVLSVFIGTMKYSTFEVELDETYGAALVDAEHDFWRCVETGEPPYPVLIDQPKVEAVRKLDMRESNAWADAAVGYALTFAAAKQNEKHGKTLKELVAPDVTEAFGHGIRAKRNKAGSISLKIEE